MNSKKPNSDFLITFLYDQKSRLDTERNILIAGLIAIGSVLITQEYKETLYVVLAILFRCLFLISFLVFSIEFYSILTNIGNFSKMSIRVLYIAMLSNFLIVTFEVAYRRETSYIIIFALLSVIVGMSLLFKIQEAKKVKHLIRAVYFLCSLLFVGLLIKDYNSYKYLFALFYQDYKLSYFAIGATGIYYFLYKYPFPSEYRVINSNIARSIYATEEERSELFYTLFLRTKWVRQEDIEFVNRGFVQKHVTSILTKLSKIKYWNSFKSSINEILSIEESWFTFWRENSGNVDVEYSYNVNKRVEDYVKFIRVYVLVKKINYFQKNEYPQRIYNAPVCYKPFVNPRIRLYLEIITLDNYDKDKILKMLNEALVLGKKRWFGFVSKLIKYLQNNNMDYYCVLVPIYFCCKYAFDYPDFSLLSKRNFLRIPYIFDITSKVYNQNTLKTVNFGNQSMLLYFPLFGSNDLFYRLLGIWQAYIPIMASGWSNRFHIYPDGKFEYIPNEMDAAIRIGSRKGNWRILNKSIELLFESKTRLKDGYKSESYGSIASDTTYEKYTTVKLKSHIVVRLFFEISVLPDLDRDTIEASNISVNGRFVSGRKIKFYKMKSSPFDD